MNQFIKSNSKSSKKFHLKTSLNFLEKIKTSLSLKNKSKFPEFPWFSLRFSSTWKFLEFSLIPWVPWECGNPDYLTYIKFNANSPLYIFRLCKFMFLDYILKLFKFLGFFQVSQTSVFFFGQIVKFQAFKGFYMTLGFSSTNMKGKILDYLK